MSRFTSSELKYVIDILRTLDAAIDPEIFSADVKLSDIDDVIVGYVEHDSADGHVFLPEA